MTVKPRRWWLASLLWALWLPGAASQAAAAQPGVHKAVDPSPVTGAEPHVQLLVQGLEHPWGMAFLPDGRMLVTERPGRIRIVSGQTLSAPLAGVPPVVAIGQGGLMDIAVSPDFANDQLVFFSFSEAAGEQGSRTAVARARLLDQALQDVTVIFRQQPAVTRNIHYGSRLVFGRDGNLWVTLGDRHWGRDRVQDLGSHLGKVVRIRPDGTVPDDNPYRRKAGALPEIWSLGHRNVQGATQHPRTGQLWTVEHGAQGGDELNRTLSGRNFGWPVITWGVEYGGAPIGEGGAKAGMEQPAHYWVPSIAPSGMAFYTGSQFPAWRGSLLVGSLKFQMLARLSFDSTGTRVIREERLLTGLGRRVRDVRQAPDGQIYLLTDEQDGQLLKLVP